jgi:hypothetical protein
VRGVIDLTLSVTTLRAATGKYEVLRRHAVSLWNQAMQSHLASLEAGNFLTLLAGKVVMSIRIPKLVE